METIILGYVSPDATVCSSLGIGGDPGCSLYNSCGTQCSPIVCDNNCGKNSCGLYF